MPKRTKDYRDELLNSLLDPVEASEYINAALEDSEEMLLTALRDVAEAHQMAKVANEAGISRESIYRMLSENGNPRLSSLLGILNAVGLKLSIEPSTASMLFEQMNGYEVKNQDKIIVANPTDCFVETSSTIINQSDEFVTIHGMDGFMGYKDESIPKSQIDTNSLSLAA